MASSRLRERLVDMIRGHYHGDACGAPYEFRCNSGVPITYHIQAPAFLASKYSRKESQIGQCTDDTEMTVALMRAIMEKDGWDRNTVIRSYLSWANSGGWTIGTNTKELMRGVSTVSGYVKRYAKKMTPQVAEKCQSNGFLMRAWPLVLLHNLDDIEADVDLTNPNPLSRQVATIYVTALHLALIGTEPHAIFRKCHRMVTDPKIERVFQQILDGTERNISYCKGWCLHALYCTLYTMIHFDNYHDGVMWVISQRGSDTDTNAAIAGALLGALYGIDDPETQQNLEIIRNCYETHYSSQDPDTVDTENGSAYHYSPLELENSFQRIYQIWEKNH